LKLAVIGADGSCIGSMLKMTHGFKSNGICFRAQRPFCQTMSRLRPLLVFHWMTTLAAFRPNITRKLVGSIPGRFSADDINRQQERKQPANHLCRPSDFLVYYHSLKANCGRPVLNIKPFFRSQKEKRTLLPTCFHKMKFAN